MRCAEFDREEVLRTVMAVLVEKGYSNVSIQHLKQVTGLHPGSLYCAFENKRGLLIAALKQYQQDQRKLLDNIFASYPSLLEGLQAYINHVLEDCEKEDARGCLLQKLLMEFSHQDEEIEQMISQMLKQWQDQLAYQIQLMMDGREIATGRDAKDLAQFLVMGIYGIRTISATRPEPGVLKKLRDGLMNHIAGER